VRGGGQSQVEIEGPGILYEFVRRLIFHSGEGWDEACGSADNVEQIAASMRQNHLAVGE
jgi:hypothetical protein